MTQPEAVLLDTCAVIWLAEGVALPAQVTEAIIAAGLARGIFVSPVSAWEIGFLSRSRPGQPPKVACRPDPKAWFARVLAGPGIRQAELTAGIAIDASHLPGDLHPDPADRMIIATSRHLGIPIVTRDRKILEYARGGHVSVIPC